jgi:hypothetical protein
MDKVYIHAFYQWLVTEAETSSPVTHSCRECLIARWLHACGMNNPMVHMFTFCDDFKEYHEMPEWMVAARVAFDDGVSIGKIAAFIKKNYL